MRALTVIVVCLTLGACSSGEKDANIELDAAAPDAAAPDAAAPDAASASDAASAPDAARKHFGEFSLTWEITQGGAPSTCDAAHVEAVIVRSTTGGTTIEDIFSCPPGSGTTDFLEVGDYTIEILGAASGSDEAITSVQTAQGTIVPDSAVSLGHFVLAVP